MEPILSTTACTTIQTILISDINPADKAHPYTRIYLQDIHGELKDHLIRVTATQLLEPSTNICAGIRWLFRKKELAKNKLKREPTWIEAVADYKDYLNDIIAGNHYNPKPMEDLKKYYHALQQGI